MNTVEDPRRTRILRTPFAGVARTTAAKSAAVRMARLFTSTMTSSGTSPLSAAAEPGRIATVEVTVLEHRPNRVKAQPYKVMVSDETALMELVFFRAHGFFGDWHRRRVYFLRLHRL